MLSPKILLHHIPAHAILQAVEPSVVLVHVIHVVIAGIMEDVELGIDAQHLLQAVLHGEDTANHHRASCLDVCIAREYLGKSLHHSPCDALVLDGTQGCQLPIAPLGFISQQSHFPERLFALGSKFAFLLRTEQSTVRHVVGRLAYHVAGAMPAIVAQIEGFVALGGRSHLLLRTAIGHIVACRERGVAAEILLWCLRRQLGCSHQRNRKEKYFCLHHVCHFIRLTNSLSSSGRATTRLPSSGAGACWGANWLHIPSRPAGRRNRSDRRSCLSC